MVDDLIKLLETFNCPVIRQGSLAEDEPYPDTFITFWVNTTESTRYYNNKPKFIYWDFYISIYSNDPIIVENLSNEVRKLLMDNNYLINGRGNDANSDEDTHTGWEMNFLKKEEN